MIDDRGQPRTAAGAASVTFVDLRSTPVDPRAAETVPPQVAEHLGVLPIAMRDGALVVAVTEPIPTEALDEVRALTGHQVTPVLTAPADLGEAISRYAAAAGPNPAAGPDPAAGAAVSGNLNPNARTVALNQPGMAGGLGLAAGTPPEAPGLVAPPPVNAPAAPAVNTPAPAAVPGAVSEVRAGRGDEPVLPFSMNGLLENMLETGASDLHLTVGVPPMIRLFGELKPMPDYPRLGPNELRALVYSILPQRQREKFETELELDCSHAVPGKARFRLNVYQQRESVGAAFRVIPVEPKPLEELGVPPQIANFARLTRGLILVTGPTGSGKSTTLAGLVDLANRERSDHIVTVEDPSSSSTGTRAASSTSARSARTPAPSPTPSSTSCARIPTSSSSGSCATWRRSRSRSPRPRPATSSSPPSTPRTRPRRSTASSTCSRPTSSSRSGSSSPGRSRGSCASSWCRPPTAPGGRSRSRSSWPPRPCAT